MATRRDVQDPDNNNSNNNNDDDDDDDDHILYTAALPQSGSSSAGSRVISASDRGQASSTGEIPLPFSRSAVGSLIPRNIPRIIKRYAFSMEGKAQVAKEHKKDVWEIMQYPEYALFTYPLECLSCVFWVI